MIFNQTVGVPLNFKVVAYSSELLLPSTAAENTIAVITDTLITDWVFSADEPYSHSDGMVWISTGASSTVEFNALKKNGLKVYPLWAFQYVNGARVRMEAMIYQNGEWVELWNGTLYDNGNQYEDYTGGWVGYGEDGPTAKRVTFGESSISIATKSAAESATVYTANPMDLTKFNKLKVELNVSSVNTALSDTVNIGISSINTNSYGVKYAIAVTKSKATGELTLECDISSVESGYPYVCSDESNFVITKIYLEA